MLPKQLDEEVARLHLGQLGVKLTAADATSRPSYIGVPLDGPVQAGSLPVLRAPAGRSVAPQPAVSGSAARAAADSPPCRSVRLGPALAAVALSV